MKINGPVEIVYVLAIIFAILSVIFLTGKGSTLIKVYNTATKESKGKEHYKRLSRGIGMCFGLIDIILLITAFMWGKLPEWINHIFIAIMWGCIVVTVALSNMDIIYKKGGNK